MYNEPESLVIKNLKTIMYRKFHIELQNCVVYSNSENLKSFFFLLSALEERVESKGEPVIMKSTGVLSLKKMKTI